MIHMKNIKFAPRGVFEKILEYAVIPTFDLVIEYGDQGIIIVKRKISPYKDQWALPGLRMFKPESIDNCLRRIAKQEVGLRIDPRKRIFLGQFTGKFRTEHNRQDISTGYLLRVSDNQKIIANHEHFHDCRIVKKIPQNMGGMYKYYLQKYFEFRRSQKKSSR
ncbi:MAG: NUDIX domain-containing protein [Candidatus Aenigmatarchaeota archaeon]